MLHQSVTPSLQREPRKVREAPFAQEDHILESLANQELNSPLDPDILTTMTTKHRTRRTLENDNRRDSLLRQYSGRGFSEILRNKRRCTRSSTQDIMDQPKVKCPVYRDYVNVHNGNGTRVLNLVLTKITRGADGQLEVKTLNNFSADKKTAGADAFFTADMM